MCVRHGVQYNAKYVIRISCTHFDELKKKKPLLVDRFSPDGFRKQAKTARKLLPSSNNICSGVSGKYYSTNGPQAVYVVVSGDD